MGSPKAVESLVLHVLGQHFCESEGVPDEGGSSEFVGEGVGSVDNRPKFNNVCVEDVVSDLRANVQQDLKVPAAEAFLVDDELSQLDEADPEDIVRDVRFEDLCDVVEDCFHVEVFVDVGGGGGLLELRQQNGLEDDDALSPHLPPRVTYDSLQS